jgi:hypothetical protein
MHIASMLDPTGIDMTPVGGIYTLPTIVSDEDTLTELSVIITGADLDTNDVDVTIDGVVNGVMHYDTDHFDYVP